MCLHELKSTSCIYWQVPFCTTTLLDNLWIDVVGASSYPFLQLLDSKPRCTLHVHVYFYLGEGGYSSDFKCTDRQCKEQTFHFCTPRSDGSFQRRRYTNVDFSVTLPAGTDVCDIGTLTVWCRPFEAIFTRIVIPRTIFVSILILAYMHLLGWAWASPT